MGFWCVRGKKKKSFAIAPSCRSFLSFVEFAEAELVLDAPGPPPRERFALAAGSSAAVYDNFERGAMHALNEDDLFTRSWCTSRPRPEDLRGLFFRNILMMLSGFYDGGRGLKNARPFSCASKWSTRTISDVVLHTSLRDVVDVLVRSFHEQNSVGIPASRRSSSRRRRRRAAQVLLKAAEDEHREEPLVTLLTPFSLAVGVGKTATFTHLLGYEPRTSTILYVSAARRDPSRRP